MPGSVIVSWRFDSATGLVTMTPSLSRRHILLGISAVGAATIVPAAFAGRTVAYNNSTVVSASDKTTDLVVEWADATLNGRSVLDRSGGELTMDATDVLPGDHGRVLFRVGVADGSSPASISFGLRAKYPENGRNDPERRAGDTSGDVGELQDHLETTVWYGEGAFGVRDLGATNGAHDIGERVLSSGTLTQVVTDLDASGTGGHDGRALAGGRCLAPRRSVSLGLKWSVPKGTGNAIQSDGVVLAFVFDASPCDGISRTPKTSVNGALTGDHGTNSRNKYNLIEVSRPRVCQPTDRGVRNRD